MSVTRKRKILTQGDAWEDAPRPRKHTKTACTPAALPPATTQRQSPRSSVGVAHDLASHTTHKRKRGQEDDAARICNKTKLARTTNAPAVPGFQTPQSKRFRDAMPTSPAETPGRKTARLFDRLELQAQKQSAASNTAYDTPPATPESVKLDFADVLPTQLTELVTLFAAFLSAVNGQTALNGASFRISMQELLTTTTKIWRLRAVSTKDIRRLLAVLQDIDVGWVVEDYGRAGLSLTKRLTATKSTSILDTIKLKRAFENELRRQWGHWQESHEQQVDIGAFIEQMPLLDVAKSDAVDKTASLYSRGKDRLESLRQSQAAMKSAESDTKTASVKPTPVHARGTNLLDRILAKQAAAASMPAGPTKEQLERRSCLQRVEEVARVLEILSAGRARASFSMPSIVQQLQQSLRSPMSRIEAERCLSLIAAEIMPQFVSIIVSGTVNGIVITRSGKLGLADLKQRLAEVDI
ncbi:hypothetical protein AMS68_000733 [Peltaster fructicola]|uniref:DNA replication factor Cdt1 C-terminal domain-containing protein n=1 Tax=Peltaster fructicola TaxID=286661 RepID=A0A6H0XKI4_9PEZI|nr:hypothetical protein AMS68_000733 [Peltaster fructicola]